MVTKLAYNRQPPGAADWAAWARFTSNHRKFAAFAVFGGRAAIGAIGRTPARSENCQIGNFRTTEIANLATDSRFNLILHERDPKNCQSGKCCQIVTSRYSC